MEHNKSSSQREVQTNTGLPLKTRKTSKKQPNVLSKQIRKRRTEPKVSRRKDKDKKEINKIYREQKILKKSIKPRVGSLKWQTKLTNIWPGSPKRKTGTQIFEKLEI